MGWMAAAQRPRGPIVAAVVSVLLAPTVWLTFTCAGLLIELPVILTAVMVGSLYLVGVVLAVWALLGIPRVGTRLVLPLGLLGGVLNAFLLTAAVIAVVLFEATYG